MPTAPEDRSGLLLPGLYTAAAQELAQRIQTRELVLVAFMAFSTAVIGASLAGGRVREFALLIPVLALACAVLSAHHDAIIGLLSVYMNEVSSDVSVSRWHDPQGKYFLDALRFRDWRVLANIAYLEVTSTVSLLISFDAAKPISSLTWPSVFWWIGIACMISIFAVFAGLRAIRHKSLSPVRAPN